MSKTRENSRLEVDDPRYCVDCGARIPCDTTAPDGTPLTWHHDKTDWVELERCPECWAEDQLVELEHDCMDRYGGELAAILAEARQ